jgi:uncharacterized membrane protein YgcG
MLRVQLAAAMTAALLLSCKSESMEPTSYLVVSPATRQPESSPPGTIVVLQQRGGAFLRIKAIGGTFMLPSDGETGQAPSCSLAPADGALLFFNVVPEDVECELSVALFDESDAGSCAGKVLATALLPITTKREPSAGSGGSGGQGTSTGGAGGKGTSTGGAGGKGTSTGGAGTGGAGG